MRGERNLGLDLVRSCAIGLVLLSHWGDMGAAFFGTRSPPWLSYSGTFGVELFFVLSGYLIGALLLEIIERGPSWQAWGRFMVRRWMRTLPLYFLWLAILAVFWRPLNTPWAHYAAYTLFLQNWAWPMPADNWFGVSWSLAIEEWFYLLFSVTLIGASLVVARKRAVWIALGLFLSIPFACRLIAQHAFGLEDPYKITLLRLDAIAYGVALARLRWENRAPFHYPGLCLCTGIGLILCTWTQMYWKWLPVPEWLFGSVFINAISIGFCLCIPAAIRLRSGTGWPALLVRRLSELSYGIYITHLTILEVIAYGVAEHRISPLLATALMMSIPLILAALSFRYFESPILARRPRQLFGSAPRPLAAEAGALPAVPPP